MDQLTATSPSVKNQLIDEQVQHCKLELVEGEGKKKGRVFARGEFGHAANPTANKRRYRHSIWENNFDRLRPNLESKKVLGELDHPTDGRTALQRASHVITGLKLEGDRVMGEAEILDTAKGRDLKAILAAGVPVGISSRGFGSTKPGNDGIEEVQEDYKLVTFDFVAEPADATAYPDVVFESTSEAQPVVMMFEGASFDDPDESAPTEPASDEPALEDDEDDDDEDEDETVEGDENLAPAVGSAPPGEAALAKRFAAKVSAEADARPKSAEEELSARFAAKVSAEADARPKSAEEEMSARFAAKVLEDVNGKSVTVEDLRREFSEQLVGRVEALRTDVEKQVRDELSADPTVAGARAALEQVQQALLPFAVVEDADVLIKERDEEVHTLRSQLEEAEDRITQHETLIETLTGAAREAGYRYHLECLLHEDDADIERLRTIVGDVSEYDSPSALQECVEAAKNEMQAFRLEEERFEQQRSAESDELRGKNNELAEGLEQALVANRDLALQVYASERLQTHPQGAKILRMLKRSGIQSKEQVNAMIEDFREPERDVDDLAALRSRVRSRLHGGQEYLQEDTQPVTVSGGHSHDYNGLGASLADLKHLAGVGDR